MVKKLIKKSKAVIVPSIWYENCSMTIMESLVLGKPVVASITGGNPELINDGYNGFTFEAGNSKALNQALQKLLALNSNELEQNAYKFGQIFFGPEAHYKSIMKVYQRVLGVRINTQIELKEWAC